ncbi:T9SS type A sorting domain-containing protein [Neolewinella sp.]|uniref:T9SS type A sorting domain-containing protein n=1 Tax=Neolewinella sp. TaxID=2993543 RepID=UPI003B51744C
MLILYTMTNTPFLLLLLLCTSYASAQTLVADDNTPGVMIPEGYDLRLGVGGLDYPSNIAGGDGRYWVSESGYDPAIPPTVKEITLPAGDTGVATIILTPAMLEPGMLAPPFTDVVYHDSLLYLAHRQMGENGYLVGAYSRFSPDNPMNTFETILTNLPSTGDHSNNTLVFGPDGRAYFGQGSATNSAVVGADNADWVAEAPDFHEMAPVDLVLNGSEFTARVPTSVDPDSNAVTAPYRPFDSGAIDSGLVIPAVTPADPMNDYIIGNGTVYSFDPEADDVAGSLRLEAWGLRNPFGLGFDAEDSTRLFVSNNGTDIRGRAGDPNEPFDTATFVLVGNRPVANDHDDLFELTVGGEVEFFGWPEFFHDTTTLEARGADSSIFCDSPVLEQDDCPGFIFASSFRDSLTVDPVFSDMGPNVSVTGFTASVSDSFGYRNDLFVTESGSFGPQTGIFRYTGYRVTRVDASSGARSPFIVNEGSTAEELLDAEGFNKPVADMFIGDTLAIVDLGVLEPGINLLQSGTGKVWLLSRTTSTATTNLGREFGASFSSVVPNPTNGPARITLHLRESLTGLITVLDLNGRLVRTVYSGRLLAGQRQFELETNGLASGTYIVRLASGGGVLSERFVVSR